MPCTVASICQLSDKLKVKAAKSMVVTYNPNTSIKIILCGINAVTYYKLHIRTKQMFKML